MSAFNTKQNWKLSSSRGKMLPHTDKTAYEMAEILRNTWENTGVDFLIAESNTTRINMMLDGSIRIAMKD